MRALVTALILSCCYLPAAHSQTSKFDAVIDADGQVTLVPSNSADTEPSITGPETAGEERHPDLKGSPVYVVTQPNGDVKAVYTDQSEALSQPLKPGESVKAVMVNSTGDTVAVAGSIFEEEYWKRLAKAAATQLMQEAKDSACGFDVKPESITPSVEVSFSAGFGGTFAVSATWLVKDLCGQD